MNVYKRQHKITDFILNEYLTFDFKKRRTGIVLTPRCVLWTSVSHYALNVEDVMTAFYTCDSVQYRRASCVDHYVAAVEYVALG